MVKMVVDNNWTFSLGFQPDLNEETKASAHKFSMHLSVGKSYVAKVKHIKRAAVKLPPCICLFLYLIHMNTEYSNGIHYQNLANAEKN